jgi:hypothetical protein
MKGIIAFFDILGYQSFLENNSASESALQVLDLITKIPVEVRQEWSSTWNTVKNKENPKSPSDITKRLTHLIFSDTILLTMPIEETDSQRVRDEALAFMGMMSMHLQYRMFLNGLPLRGVIHEGSYIVKDTCFAGSGIVEAYKQCADLDFSGLVYSPPLFERIKERQAGPDAIFSTHNFDAWFVEVLSPLKNGRELRLCHPNWIGFLQNADKRQMKADVIQFVMKTFWSHKKDCPTSVDSKIRNTCKIFRRLMIADDLQTEISRKEKALETKRQN